MDPEVQEVVARLFARKLEQFQTSLNGLGDAGSANDSSSMVRSTRVAACEDPFRSHCARVLRDYVNLLELFDALASPDAVGDTFNAHVDQTASGILTSIGANGNADRNRIMNQAAGIKAEARTQLDEAIERARRANQAGADAPDELDDRLPLGRRGAFDRDLARCVVESAREREPFALVMIDIDHFKQVNDVHGHPVGDEVLLELAKLIVDRSVGKGAAYRFGGEEFSLLLRRYSAEEAVGLAERIRKDLEAAVVSSQKLRVTASFGVASVPAHASEAAALLEKADAALYDAKHGGRNRVATPT